MDGHTVEKLAERLERLERQNRRWRNAAVAFGMFGAVGLLIGAARQGGGPRVVEAERFVIKGDDGKVYAELGVHRNEAGVTSRATRLAFFDDDGAIRTNYGVGPDQTPSLQLMGRDGSARASMGMAGEEEWTSLSITSKSGKSQVRVGSANASGIDFWGPGEREGLTRQVGRLLVADDGSMALSMFRPHNAPGSDVHERVHLGVGRDGTPKLGLKGEDFQGGIKALVKPDGTATLTGVEPEAR